MTPCLSRAFVRSQRGEAVFVETAVLISLLAILSACGDAKIPRTDREEAKLIGPVRSVVEKDSLYISEYRYAKDGRLVEVERQCISTVLCPNGPRTTITQYVHDLTGRMVSGVEYGKDRSVINREAYAYDENGNLTATVHASSSGELWSGSFRWYDNAGKEIGATSFIGKTGGTRAMGRTEYIYDENGRATKTLHYTEEGKISLELQRTYDGRGRLHEVIGYLPEGSVDKRSVFVYDARGVEAERVLYDSKGMLERKFTSEYQYDQFGNWTKRISRIWENHQGKEVLKETHVTERTVAYYE